MENFDLIYKLSLYESLTTLRETDKSKIEIVKSSLDGLIYIKKTLSNYNIEVYEKLMEVKSPNIPKIYEVIEYNKKLIIIEEYINGRNLNDILTVEKTLAEETALDYIILLCNALEKLHTLNKPIIHRDIKPSNILIFGNGIVKLIDFDASRVYKEESFKDTIVLGTHGYAAPEQFVSVQTDNRSDIYSIGVLLNILLKGKHPREELIVGECKGIVEKCISLEPDNRYKSVMELRDEIVKIKNKNKKSIKTVGCKNKYIKTYDKNKNVKKSRNRFFNILKQVPGFRTGNLLKQIISVLFYLFLVTGLAISDKGTILENITIIIMLLLLWLLYTNFKGVTTKFPLMNTTNKYKKFFGYYLYTTIITLLAGGILDLL